VGNPSALIRDLFERFHPKSKNGDAGSVEPMTISVPLMDSANNSDRTSIEVFLPLGISYDNLVMIRKIMI
jgi:hypothetical protein